MFLIFFKRNENFAQWTKVSFNILTSLAKESKLKKQTRRQNTFHPLFLLFFHYLLCLDDSVVDFAWKKQKRLKTLCGSLLFVCNILRVPSSSSKLMLYFSFFFFRTSTNQPRKSRKITTEKRAIMTKHLSWTHIQGMKVAMNFMCFCYRRHNKGST